MTQPEYEQKKRECWEEFIGNDGFPTETMRQCFNYAFDRAYTLGKQEKDAEDDKTLKVNRQLFCRLCADADDYINEHLEEEDSDYDYYQGRSDALHELYRGVCKDPEDTAIQGWVARDKDGLLNFFYGGSTPYKNDNDGDWNTAFGRVLEYVPREMFPDLTWSDGPIEVELIIKRKKNG